MNTRHFTKRIIKAVTAAVVILCTSWAAMVQAQTVQIRFRPLTPREIKNAGLPATTQKTGGAQNVGIGQPVYIEALVQTGTVVNAVNWTLVRVPGGSLLATNTPLDPGPLSNAVPTYDGGDRISLFVAGRAMFKPDSISYFDFNPAVSNISDYRIRTDIILTNKVLSFTNSVYGSTYLGQKHELCVLCHANKQAEFDLTDHANAFKNQINGAGSDHFNPNCISCHTLGYDTTSNAVNNGFDDIALQEGWTFPLTLSPTNWSNVPTNLQHRANVQCENCHGPASTHMTSLGRTNAIDVTLSAGTCGQCHDSLPQHVKVYEWGQSLHSTGYVFRFSGSCVPCHSSVGFIETWDPYYASTGKTPRATAQEGIACAACHDPHTPGMGEHQLRAVNTATLSNGVVVTESQAGTGVLCMNCHHARQNGEVYVMGSGSGSISPHHGTQGDMLLGENAIEYGLNMPSSRHLLAVTNSCVGCHMQLIAGTSFSNANTRVGGHTFKMAWGHDTPQEDDDIKVTEVCSVCHVESGTFDFGGEDYDRDGTVEGVQSEIQGLLDQLALLLPPVGASTVSVNLNAPLSQKKAAYNYWYVWEDKSLGVHNPKYAAAILQASIDDLTGGIDIDKDGLIDSWEMENFGNLTSQTGSGDYDGDGVSNELEQSIHTDPKKWDTDNDGISDLAELQGGSNPLDIASLLPTNTVMQMLPAVELGYMPEMTGKTQVFQYVSAIDPDKGWTNAGPAFISSNAVQYQLISLRDATQKYFRVVAP